MKKFLAILFSLVLSTDCMAAPSAVVLIGHFSNQIAIEGDQALVTEQNEVPRPR
jgi:hypothetical protein